MLNYGTAEQSKMKAKKQIMKEKKKEALETQ